MQVKIHLVVSGMFSLFMSGVAVHAGTVLYVDDDAEPGGTGLSWASPMKYLADAIGAAESQGIEEIRIAQGTYRPDQSSAAPDGTDDRSASFDLLEGIDLIGGYMGPGTAAPDLRRPSVTMTILSGDLLANDDGDEPSTLGDNSFHVVTAIGVSAATIIDGLHVTGGNANGRGADANGGGMLIVGGSPRIVNIMMSDNAASLDGGAVYVDGGSMTIVNSVFHHNSAQRGGAINFEDAAHSYIYSSTFSKNSAIVGGAIRAFSTPWDMGNCIVWDNGLLGMDGSAPTMSFTCTNTLYPDETVFDADPMFVDADAGDFRVAAGSPVIDAGSSLLIPPGGMPATDIAGSPRIIDVTSVDDCPYVSTSCGSGPLIDLGAFEGMNALVGVDGGQSLEEGWYTFDILQPHGEMTPIVDGGPSFTMIEEIDTPNGAFLFGAPHEIRHVGFGWGSWSHSGPVTGELFWTMGHTSVSYTLPPGTEAFDAYVEPNCFSFVSFDVTAITSLGESIEVVEVALGSGGASHFGFYTTDGSTIESVSIDSSNDFAVAEMRFAPLLPACPPDLNDDGSVGPADLALLLGTWGPINGDDPADLNDDGVIGPADLAILLGSWGPCS